MALTLTSIDVDLQRGRPPRRRPRRPSRSSPDGRRASFHWQGLKLIFTPSAKLPLSTTFHVHVAAGRPGPGGQRPGRDRRPRPSRPSARPRSRPWSPACRLGLGRRRLRRSRSRSIGSWTPQKVIAGLTLQPDIAYQASWNGTVLTLDAHQAAGVRRRPTRSRSPTRRSIRTGRKLPAVHVQLQDRRHRVAVASVTPAPERRPASTSTAGSRSSTTARSIPPRSPGRSSSRRRCPARSRSSPSPTTAAPSATPTPAATAAPARTSSSSRPTVRSPPTPPTR